MKWMTKRGYIRLFSYAIAVVAILAGFAIVNMNMAANYKAQLENNYQQSLNELSETMDSIETNLTKSIYSNSDKMLYEISSDLYSECTKAKDALSRLPVGQMNVLPGIVELRYCLNDGMAFSMLAGKQGLLIGMTSVMLLVVLVMLFTRKMTAWERVAWTLVLGGGVGNLIDRVLNGVVVDYINVLFMHFAIFNFADICVCVGVGLLLLVVLLDSCKKEKPAEQKADDDGAA